MSFSLSGRGTREQVLTSLATQAKTATEDGQAAHDLLARFLSDAPETSHDGHEWIYEASASGHHTPGGHGSTPSLNITLTCRAGAKSE